MAKSTSPRPLPLPVGGMLRRDDVGPRHHAAGAQANPHDLGSQRRQEIRQTGLAHPGAEIKAVATLDEQRVRLPDRWDPVVLLEAGQRGELEHAERLPAEAAHGARIRCADGAIDRAAAARHRMERRRNAERAGLGDRLAEQADQRLAQGRVVETAGREKKPHARLMVPLTHVRHRPLSWLRPARTASQLGSAENRSCRRIGCGYPRRLDVRGAETLTGRTAVEGPRSWRPGMARLDLDLRLSRGRRGLQPRQKAQSLLPSRSRT